MHAADDPGHVLLRDLNGQARRIVDAGIERVTLAPNEILFDVGEDIDRVWFIGQGLVSLVRPLEDGVEVDGITVGRHGTLGLPASLGSRQVISRAVVLAEGVAWSLPGEDCRRLMAIDAAFNARVMRYYEAVFAAVVQLTACNAAHSIEQRLCRFLLTCRDQLGSDVLPMRQEFLSRMLGVNRTSITPLSRRLQDDGAILVRHGRVQLRSIERLTRRACACHAIIQARFSAVA